MTNDVPDYYAILGVASTASQGEIARAYRHQVRSRHPDLRRDTESGALADVLAAYAVLRDPARRADYDREREPPAPPPRTGPLLRAGPVRYHGPPHRGHERR